MVSNPVAAIWVVHVKEAGFAERLRVQGGLGVFENLPFARPGASFFLVVGTRCLLTNRPFRRPNQRKKKGARRPLSSHGVCYA
jgi:hypothetical protein